MFLLLPTSLLLSLKRVKKTQERDLRGLRAFMAENIFKKFLLVSFNEFPRIMDGIEIIHWKEFLAQLKSLLLE